MSLNAELASANFFTTRKFQIWVTVVALGISFALLIPRFFYPKAHYGQLSKQTFAAQMIESTAKGDVAYGVFPTRHFVETFHPGLIPWAEEVPIYSEMSAALVKVFHLSPIQAGKTWSVLAFCFLIYGFYRVGLALGAPPLLFALVASIFPVFRLYSIEVMPDLCMSACLVWMIERVLRKKDAEAAVFLLLASLFKYYAVFTGFGVGLYFLSQKRFKPCVYFTLAVIPCVAYIAWFLKLGIPNPITEYRSADGHGHLSSLEVMVNPKNWVRVGLWWFVKNASIAGTALAFWGGAQLYQSKEKNLKTLAIGLLVGFVLFPIFFMSSFFVHDYYGLQGSIGIALLAAFGLTSLYQKKPIAAWASALALLVFSAVSVQTMSKPVLDFEQAESFFDSFHFPKNEFILTTSGISSPVVPFHVGQDAFLADSDKWDRPEVAPKLLDPKLHVVTVQEFLNQEGLLAKIDHDLEASGFKLIAPEQRYSQTVFQIWSR